MDDAGAWLADGGLYYVFKWLFCVSGVVAVAWLQHEEDFRLRALSRVAPDGRLPPYMALAAGRAAQVLGLLIALVVLIVLRDIQIIREAAAPPPEPAAAPAVYAPAPAAAVQPAPQVQAPAQPARPANPMPFQNITVFSEKNAATQAYLDLIKQRYEELMVTYYYLLRCQAADVNDSVILRSAMNEDLRKAGASAQTGNNIIQAAQGTYAELYARSACRDSDISNIKQSFEKSMAQLKQQHP
jgi:hypothetical protein